MLLAFQHSLKIVYRVFLSTSRRDNSFDLYLLLLLSAKTNDNNNSFFFRSFVCSFKFYSRLLFKLRFMQLENTLKNHFVCIPLWNGFEIFVEMSMLKTKFQIVHIWISASNRTIHFQPETVQVFERNQIFFSRIFFVNEFPLSLREVLFCVFRALERVSKWTSKRCNRWHWILLKSSSTNEFHSKYGELNMI